MWSFWVSDQKHGDLFVSAKLTLRGRGFDASNTAKNIVNFTPTNTKALAFKSTRTTLDLSFTHLSPLNHGVDLTASVTVHMTWSTQEMYVSKLLAANPTVVDDGSVISSDSSKFTALHWTIRFVMRALLTVISQVGILHVLIHCTIRFVGHIISTVTYQIGTSRK